MIRINLDYDAQCLCEECCAEGHCGCADCGEPCECEGEGR